MIARFILWLKAHRNAKLRENDYWAYKDGEVIDTNAAHYKDIQP